MTVRQIVIICNMREGGSHLGLIASQKASTTETEYLDGSDRDQTFTEFLFWDKHVRLPGTSVFVSTQHRWHDRV